MYDRVIDAENWSRARTSSSSARPNLKATKSRGLGYPILFRGALPRHSHSIVQTNIKPLISRIIMALGRAKTDYWLVKMLRF
jgi:hypothetical protein